MGVVRLKCRMSLLNRTTPSLTLPLHGGGNYRATVSELKIFLQIHSRVQRCNVAITIEHQRFTLLGK
jgi:hypothetical protein